MSHPIPLSLLLSISALQAHFFRFGAFWLFQLFWVWTVSLPLTILNSPALSPTEAYPNPSPKFGAGSDVAGVVLWVLGFMLEVFADQQKYNFKSSRPPKGTIADIGTWVRPLLTSPIITLTIGGELQGYSRHPNFFGEILLWWALWILCIQPAIARSAAPNARSALYGSIVSPIFISRASRSRSSEGHD
jgi:steroid 5-alpha reductase family enzyme